MWSGTYVTPPRSTPPSVTATTTSAPTFTRRATSRSSSSYPSVASCGTSGIARYAATVRSPSASYSASRTGRTITAGSVECRHGRQDHAERRRFAQRVRRADHPLHRGRWHRRRHLARVAARARRRGREVRQEDLVERGARRREGVQRDGRLASRGDGAVVPRPSHRHQGPADHTGGRRHPLAERRAAPDPRPLRVPAPGPLLRRRPVAGEASRARRHGDLPREHRGRLRRHGARGVHSRGEEARRLRDERVRLERASRLGLRPEADERVRVEAPDPRRAAVRDQPRPQVGDDGAQGQHHEVHRGRVPRLGLRPRARGVQRRRGRLGRLRWRIPATRSS